MKNADIHILGGGPAGLTTGYYAKKRGLDFSIYEAGAHAGGNCRTLRLGDFRFDTGAHRFHDKDAQTTQEVKALLGDALSRVDAPSEIFFEGKFYRFPLTLSDLTKKLDARTLGRIAWENVSFKSRSQADDFATFAINQYGRTLAERFLLNYSEKLWGEAPHNLSTAIAGNRLKGLDLRGFLRSRDRNPRHLDGPFLYPKYGIGMISDKLCKFIGAEHIKLNHRVSRIIHRDGKIARLVLNDDIDVHTTTVINTLPLTLTTRILAPPPPPEIRALADRIKYRHIVVCVFCLERAAFSPNASLYFPDAWFPFTRLYEPKNRSAHMAPEGQTAIVLELPCYRDDAVWTLTAEALKTKVWKALRHMDPTLSTSEIIDYRAYRLPFAYPVLEVGFEENVAQLVAYFEKFENLYLTGRSSRFRYLHIHDLFKAGRELVETHLK